MFVLTHHYFVILHYRVGLPSAFHADASHAISHWWNFALLMENEINAIATAGARGKIN